MMHPDTEVRFTSPEIGVGVFATRFIPRGSLVWALDEFDLVLTPAQVAALAWPCRQVLEKYAYVDEAGCYVHCWDHARLVNHSCDASDWGVGASFEIAVRDLNPGDELTSDYAVLNITAPFTCRCGRPGCRGRIGPADAAQHWRRWDTRVAAAFPLVSQVEQPLLPFLKHRRYLDELIAGAVPLPSYQQLRAVRIPLPHAATAAEDGLWRLTPDPRMDAQAPPP